MAKTPQKSCCTLAARKLPPSFMSFIQHRDSVQFVTALCLIPKRILVVAHDRMLRTTRVSILENEGYTVSSAVTDDDAMTLLETEQFDLILLGRKSQVPKMGLDQRLREKHPNLLIFKIQPAGDVVSLFPTRTTDAVPDHVLSALKEMLVLESAFTPCPKPRVLSL